VGFRDSQWMLWHDMLISLTLAFWPQLSTLRPDSRDNAQDLENARLIARNSIKVDANAFALALQKKAVYHTVNYFGQETTDCKGIQWQSRG